MKSRDTRASKADATAYSTTTAAIGSVIAGPNVAVLLWRNVVSTLRHID